MDVVEGHVILWSLQRDNRNVSERSLYDGKMQSYLGATGGRNGLYGCRCHQEFAVIVPSLSAAYLLVLYTFHAPNSARNQ